MLKEGEEITRTTPLGDMFDAPLGRLMVMNPGQVKRELSQARAGLVILRLTATIGFTSVFVLRLIVLRAR